jgi:hypothetical protein
MRRRGCLAVLLSLACAALPGCAKPVDLKQNLQVTDVSTGFFDGGIVDGKNRLLPSVTFKLKKSPGVDIPALSLNMVFKAEGADDGEDVFVQRVDFANGNETAPMTVRSPHGYTGDPPQTRAEMLKNSQFRDMDVQIFAKQTSSQWVELHKARVARQILTQ